MLDSLGVTSRSGMMTCIGDSHFIGVESILCSPANPPRFVVKFFSDEERFHRATVCVGYGRCGLILHHPVNATP